MRIVVTFPDEEGGELAFDQKPRDLVAVEKRFKTKVTTEEMSYEQLCYLGFIGLKTRALLPNPEMGFTDFVNRIDDIDSPKDEDDSGPLGESEDS